MRTIVYVEGGGNQRKALDDCRRGFGRLFEKVVPGGHMPRVIACGDRASTFRDFQNEIRQGTERFPILLVDSEGPVTADITSWAYLKAKEGWRRPRMAQVDQAHLMVQCMESWFLADREALSEFYGQRFLVNSLPAPPNIEETPKQDVERALSHAARHTRKGPYHKTRHGFELLANIDPVRLRAASIHARRLFEVVEVRAAAELARRPEW